MMLPQQPGSPTLTNPPLRTPIPVEEKQVRIAEKGPWGIWLSAVLVNTVQYLLKLPSSYSGLAADIPNATFYPENSRYWATDTTAEYINLYATPGDPSTAVWTAM